LIRDGVGLTGCESPTGQMRFASRQKPGIYVYLAPELLETATLTTHWLQMLDLRGTPLTAQFNEDGAILLYTFLLFPSSGFQMAVDVTVKSVAPSCCD
jgi:hypothetical protein